MSAAAPECAVDVGWVQQQERRWEGRRIKRRQQRKWRGKSHGLQETATMSTTSVLSSPCLLPSLYLIHHPGRCQHGHKANLCHLPKLYSKAMVGVSVATTPGRTGSWP